MTVSKRINILKTSLALGLLSSLLLNIPAHIFATELDFFADDYLTPSDSDDSERELKKGKSPSSEHGQSAMVIAAFSLNTPILLAKCTRAQAVKPQGEACVIIIKNRSPPLVPSSSSQALI